MTRLHDTLTDLLLEACGRQRSIRFIDGERDETVLSVPGLYERALMLLGALQARGMRSGDELLIFSRSNERFLVAFWAAILGGIVPVPVAVGISDEHKCKLFRILAQLERATLFTETVLLDRLLEFADAGEMTDVRALLETCSVRMSDAGGETRGTRHEASPSDLAFIQYSSGSTSEPKGVCLSHRNLCTNIRAIIEATRWDDGDHSLSWMPLTHDMGLIGFHLSVMAAGMDHAVMDTNLFVRRPLLWMRKASELRATQLCSPNFGYKHFLKLYERKGLPDDTDLSSIRLVMNGAEPISWDLCEAFLDALEPLGMSRSAMYPVYGLAEASVGVSLGEPGKRYSRIVADRHGLSIGDEYRAVAPDTPDAVSFVRVGNAIRDCEIRIVGDDDEPLKDGRVGHIQLRGASVTRQIYADPAATAALFSVDGWLRTGDCGLFSAGELVITGRRKDLIIVNGQNYYPHDIEEIVAGLDGLDLGKVVVAGATLAAAQTEELLVFVLHRQGVDAFRPLAEQVARAVGEHVGLAVDHVIPVSRIPKTTSGKLQRAQLLRDYQDGAFAAVLDKLAPAAATPSTDVVPLLAELMTLASKFSQGLKIGPDDNLFEVGLSSLMLTEIVLAIDERYPGKVDISDLFDVPTLREVAGVLRDEAR